MIQQHSRPAPPIGFVINSPALPSELITFRIALAANNLSGLEEKVLAISDPSNPEYGQFLTQSEARMCTLYYDWNTNEGIDFHR